MDKDTLRWKRIEKFLGIHEFIMNTLSTYIRNAIGHPDPTRTFTHQELRNSIELLIKLCR